MQEIWQRFWQAVLDPAGIFFIASLAGRLAVMAVIRLKPDLLSRRAWKIILLVSTAVLLCSLIYPIYHLIMPIIQEFKYKGPIILMALAVLLFVIFSSAASIWFYVQQSKIIASPSQTATVPQTVTSHPQLDKINQLDDIIKAQARLYLLANDLPKFEQLKEQYDKIAIRSYEMHIEYTLSDSRITFVLSQLTNNIKAIVKNDFNEDIDLVKINTKKYDLNKPLQEEDNIIDNVKKYAYRKARYEFLTSKETMNNLSDRYKKEIRHNQFIINDYAKKNILKPQ